MNKHTQGDWIIITSHPVFPHSTLIMADMVPTDKIIGKGKLICEISDVRGDVFEGIDSDEREANINLLANASKMKQALTLILDQKRVNDSYADTCSAMKTIAAQMLNKL